MITIFNDIIPFNGYKAATIFPFCFVRSKLKDVWNTKECTIDRTHEAIHYWQQFEFMLIGGVLAAILFLVCGCGWWSFFALPIYFWWYGVEYVIRRIIYGKHKTAYKNISFEQEAFLNEYNPRYPASRNMLASLKYVFQKTY